ncbi:hypothetical protein [Jatrophihabitans endophyticus]|uniref:hypothetical protein n=1 Tax=Jatrophihabitans endophyticus TaxID=1206085 RepID=UPI0019E7D69A|nr:hypothetical protein [Jatrophihabitans endophyticus]MBE7189628.1 hypothetical protein [Jatrophihabitans endophyticus]
MSAKVLCSAAAGVALLAGMVVAPTGASAAASCTAWGTLPSHVKLRSHPVTVHMTLRGSDACHTGGVDNGGTATLHGPGATDPQRWARLGSTDTQTFQVRVNRPGTYTLGHGDIQIYNRREVLVPVHWRRTSMDVTR